MVQSNTQRNKYKNKITDLQMQIANIKSSFENNLQQQQYSLNSKATMKVSDL